MFERRSDLGGGNDISPRRWMVGRIAKVGVVAQMRGCANRAGSGTHAQPGGHRPHRECAAGLVLAHPVGISAKDRLMHAFGQCIGPGIEHGIEDLADFWDVVVGRLRAQLRDFAELVDRAGDRQQCALPNRRHPPKSRRRELAWGASMADARRVCPAPYPRRWQSRRRARRSSTADCSHRSGR